MKRTHDATVDQQAQWVCFVRDDVGIAGRDREPHDPTFTCLFFFDKASTPDADKILALLRKYISDSDEMINVVLHLAVQGRHPRYLGEYDDTKTKDPVEGSGYERLLEDDDDVAFNRLLEQTAAIGNFGTWKSFPSDDAGGVDMECERVIRFHTKF